MSIHPSKRLLAISATAVLVAAMLPVARAGAEDNTVPLSPIVLVDEVTGAGATTDTKATWDVGATDLGVIWNDGDGGVLVAYGDTFSQPGADGAGFGGWRSNVLFRSTDQDLSDGMTYDWALTGADGKAKEIVGSKKVPGDEHTTIPTGGVAVGGRQYLAYMSVKEWGPPGQWTTNFSQLLYSDDAGATWSAEGAPRWQNNAEGTDPFQMVAFVHHEGYVYMYGTPNGRLGAVSVARVPDDKMLDKNAYAYWDGAAWGTDYAKAAEVVPAAAAELSVRYDAERDLWQMITLNGDANLVLRVSDSPEGPWGAEQILATQAEYPGLYGGYMHPWSKGADLYFLMSVWNEYNVAMMKVTLDDDGQIVRPNLLVDPSFERSKLLDVPDGWRVQGGGGIDTVSAWAKVGRHQFWVRNNQGTQLMTQDVAVAPRTTYRLVGWLKTGDSVGGNAGEGRIGVRQVGPGAKVLGEETFGDLGGWTRFEVEFDSGDNGRVQVYAGSAMTADRWVQGDDFSLVAISDQRPPSPSPSPSPTPTPTKPTPTASATPSSPGYVPKAPYEMPGLQYLNGRWWYTQCSPYSQTLRCRTDIWSTSVQYRNGKFIQKTDWHFNNLTYLPFMTREAWAGNPLGTPGTFTSAGRRWKTECDTPATGRGACRSYVWVTNLPAATKGPGGATVYRLIDTWVFNNLVRFR